jgi:hypothetical protein
MYCHERQDMFSIPRAILIPCFGVCEMEFLSNDVIVPRSSKILGSVQEQTCTPLILIPAFVSVQIQFLFEFLPL